MPTLTASREQYLLKAALSDPDAFRELYRAYFPRIYAYTAYRIGYVRDVEDVVAQIFLKCLRSLADFDYRGEGAFAAWIFRIAYSEVTQYYRQQHRSLAILPLDDLPEIQSSEFSPDQQLQRKEQFRYLHQQIMRLTPRRQEIITLKFFGGLRNAEIALVLNLDERTIASHLSRALDDLQRFYDALELEE